MDWASAIWAGLVATAAMTALMYIGKAMGVIVPHVVFGAIIGGVYSPA